MGWSFALGNFYSAAAAAATAATADDEEEEDDDNNGRSRSLPRGGKHWYQW